MGFIIGILVIFALIAAIFGRQSAQNAFHLAFGTISILVLIAITIAAPPVGLGTIAFVAFIYFCKWEAQDAQRRAERLERERQAARMNQGIGQMQGMLNHVNAAAAQTRALPSKPPAKTVPLLRALNILSEAVRPARGAASPRFGATESGSILHPLRLSARTRSTLLWPLREITPFLIAQFS